MWLTFVGLSPFATQITRRGRPGHRTRSTISTDATVPNVSQVPTSFRTEFFIAHDVRLTRWHEALVAAAPNIASTSEDRSTMYLPRKSLLPLALAIGLFGTPMLTPVHAPGTPGGVAHPPAVQLQAAERVTRRRRRIRGSKVRALLSRAVGGVRGAAMRIHATNTRLQTRRAPHDVLARGPPRSPDL